MEPDKDQYQRQVLPKMVRLPPGFIFCGVGPLQEMVVICEPWNDLQARAMQAAFARE